VADYVLRFYRDAITSGDSQVSIPSGIRTIYVRAGSAQIGQNTVAADDAYFCGSAVRIAGGEAGATLWRCEFAARDAAPVFLPNTDSALLLEAPLTTLPPDGGLMMRCDSVAFPLGGCAFTHTHKGPGIRCLEKGSIRIDSGGHSTHFREEQPWFEAGPVPVFAQADATHETRFIRVSILPRSLKGKSSISYVLPEDQDKPKPQTYRGYFDEFIEI
jgi:hypothetical protein